MTNIELLTGPTAPPKNGGAPKSIVMLLHGYGSNGDDLIAFASYWRDALPHTLFVAPNAPQRSPGGFGGYQWWALDSFDAAALAAGLRIAAPAVNAYIDDLLARYGLTPDKLALVGFSQGTMMALHVGPRRQPQIAAILGYSGMLADQDQLADEGRAKPPTLLIHGDRDDVLPIEALHHAQTVLTDLGFEVATHISRGLDHGVDDAGLALGRDFLAKRLG